MVVVAFIWEEGWFETKDELNLWHFPMKEFGVDELAAVSSAPRLTAKSNKIREFGSVEQLIQHYQLPIIIGTEDGEALLQNFTHPEDAIYLFNRTSGGQLPIKPEHTVCVETHLNKGLLWGHQAASIILYDRLIKSWQ